MIQKYDIILSGPISGTDDYQQRFAIAYVTERQRFRIENGREAVIFNPAMLPQGRANEWSMRVCIDAIFDSTDGTLIQMNGWENSKGAQAEYSLALCLGRKIRKVTQQTKGKLHG